MNRFQKTRKAASDLGNLVKGSIGVTLFAATIPVALYCTIADTVDIAAYHNINRAVRPDKPSPNYIDYPDGPKERLPNYKRLVEKYILEKFF